MQRLQVSSGVLTAVSCDSGVNGDNGDDDDDVIMVTVTRVMMMMVMMMADPAISVWQILLKEVT